MGKVKKRKRATNLSRPLNYSLGDVINKWRASLDLENVAMFDGPLLTERLRVPHTYCWSPALVPKPADWDAHIGTNLPELRALSATASGTVCRKR